MIFTKIPYVTLLAADANRYQYIQPGGISFNITAILIGLLLGGLLACILSVFFHASIGKLFRTLMSFRAYSRESAKTLSEMEIRLSYPLRRALLSRHSLLRKLLTVVLPDGTVIPPIHSLDDDLAKKAAEESHLHAERAPIVHAEEGEDTSGGVAPVEAEAPSEVDPRLSAMTFDPAAARYFLDDVHRRRAEIRFASGHGNEMRLLIPVIIVFLILATTLPVYLPYFVELLDTVIATILGG